MNLNRGLPATVPLTFVFLLLIQLIYAFCFKVTPVHSIRSSTFLSASYFQKYSKHYWNGLTTNINNGFIVDQKERYILALESKIQSLESQIINQNQFDTFRTSLPNDQWLVGHTYKCGKSIISIELNRAKTLHKGSLVIDNYGVIGTLRSDCNSKFCNVSLINDGNTKLIVSDESGQRKGVYELADQKPQVAYINHVEELSRDDIMYTSGNNVLQPSGFLVGYVDEINHSNGHASTLSISLPERTFCPNWVAVFKGSTK